MLKTCKKEKKESKLIQNGQKRKSFKNN